MAVTPNGELVTASWNQIIVRKVSNGEVIRSIEEPTLNVWSLAVLKSGELVIGSSNGMILIMNLKTGQLVGQMIGHTDKVLKLLVLPWGELVSY